MLNKDCSAKMAKNRPSTMAPVYSTAVRNLRNKVLL